MERLTKIDKYGHPYTNENVNCRNLVSEDGVNYQFVEYENNVKAYDGKPIDKLSKLEDLEDELGIPLEVLFKALLNGILDEDGRYHSKVRLSNKLGYIGLVDEEGYCWDTKKYLDKWWIFGGE
jgi:hypothetical protein